VVLLPIGAAAKEHGRHLPLKTDLLLARAFAEEVRKILPVVVAPVVCFGYYPAFRHYPGSQHLSPATFQAVVTEILEGFVAQGAKNLAIVNTGVSTEPPLRIAVRELYERSGVRVPVVDIRNLGRSADHLFEQKLGGHGDEHETSLILAIEPDAVGMDVSPTDYGHVLEQPETVFYVPGVFSGDPTSGPDYSETGIRGDATLATAEKGRAALDATARDLIDGLRALFPDATGAPDG
jgi:creatinine amidohydrolase/Fe(II)-dependent formamide hydrolase-like protein